MKSSRIVILFILTLSFCSCFNNNRKEILWKAFCDFHMRHMPISIAYFDKIYDYDMVYQDKNTLASRYNYPNTFVIGLYNSNRKSYDRIHTIEGFSPKDNYKLVKTASNFYSTDTTYLANIQYTDTVHTNPKNIALLKDTMYCISKNQYQATYRMNTKKYVVLIYRKTDVSKRDKITREFMMWKREIISLEGYNLKTELLEKMNEHTF